MQLRTVFLVCLVACLTLGLASGAQAASLLLYTQNTWEGGSGGVGLPDDEFIAWVQGSLGHTVVKIPVAAALTRARVEADIVANDAKLIIIGPRNASGNYTDKSLNLVNMPMLALMAHAIRSDRMGWVTAGAGGDNAPWTSFNWIGSDPRTAGIGSQVYVYPDGFGDTRWTQAVYDTSTGIVVSGGTGKALGERADTAPANHYAEFIEWEKGGTLAAPAPNNIAAERRVFLGVPNWARWMSGAPTPHYVSFETNINADGKLLLGRVINDLVVPEPGSLALLGMGLLGIGFAWLRRGK